MKYAFVPEQLVTDDLRSYSAAGRQACDRMPARSRAMEKPQSREFASAGATAGAQDAAVQRPGSAPEISFHVRRRIQTPSTFNAISSYTKSVGV